MTVVMSEEHARAVAEAAYSLQDAALGCKAGGFDPVGCAPQLYRSFSSSSAVDMSAVMVQVWACETSADVLTQGLTACQSSTGARAFADDEIASAIQATLSLTWSGLAQIGDRTHEIGLFQGDLTQMKTAEWVSALVVSCLPGDYSPTPGSMIEALQAIGVSVSSLARSPEIDLRGEYGCWVSSSISGQAFGRLLVLETTGADPTTDIPRVFDGLAAWLPTPPPNLTLASAMLSTGSGGADPSTVLTALFTGAKTSMSGGYGLAGLKIVNYNASWLPSLQQVFDRLIGQ